MTPTHRLPALPLLLTGVIVAGICSPGDLRAQRKPPTAEELQAKYDAEVALPFVAQGNWVLDYDQARARAAAEGKLIFAYFSRSYAH